MCSVTTAFLFCLSHNFSYLTLNILLWVLSHVAMHLLSHLIQEKIAICLFYNIKSALVSLFFKNSHLFYSLTTHINLYLFFSTKFSTPGLSNSLLLALWTPPTLCACGHLSEKDIHSFHYIHSFMVGPGTVQQLVFAIHQLLFHGHKHPGKFISMLLWPLKSLLSFLIHVFFKVNTYLIFKSLPQQIDLDWPWWEI